MSAPAMSLEERVDRVHSLLTLIHAAVNVSDDIVDPADVGGAVNQAARDALDLLEPLRHVPAKIGNWEPAAEKGGA